MTEPVSIQSVAFVAVIVVPWILLVTPRRAEGCYRNGVQSMIIVFWAREFIALRVGARYNSGCT